MAITLHGNWTSGKAYDLHTVASTHIGTNEYGHDRFDTTRSEMGQLLYELKYKYDKSAVDKIVTLLDAIGGIEKFDCLVPIPPTNKRRPIKPVDLIADALGRRRGVPVVTNALTNAGNEELKGITDPVARNELLGETLKLEGGERFEGKKVLLVDDLYRSGSTLRVVTALLLQEKAAQVSVLTMTKTRSNQ